MPSTRLSDGEEGRASSFGETEPYDAVILDLGLPKDRRRQRAQCLAALRKKVMPGDPSSPPATAGATRCRASMPAPTTTSPSRSTWKSCSRGVRAAFCAAPPATPLPRIACGPVALDTRAGRVLVNDMPVKLTSHEYRLMAYLMHHKGRVVSRTELTEHMYDQDFDRDSNTIEVFVGRLPQEARRRYHPDGEGGWVTFWRRSEVWFGACC